MLSLIRWWGCLFLSIFTLSASAWLRLKESIYFVVRVTTNIILSDFHKSSLGGLYFMQEWLSDFTYSISMEWWMFVIAALARLLIAGVTVSFRSFRYSQPG